jgi:hypothetical protein
VVGSEVKGAGERVPFRARVEGAMCEAPVLAVPQAVAAA